MSIQYYDENAEHFINNTFELSMENLTSIFLRKLPTEAKILDLGCGSGRDSLYFENKGYHVTAVDGSIEMVRHTQHHITGPVIYSTFEDFTTQQKFDGIWALASLLHVPRSDFRRIVQKYIDMLKLKGVLFMSLKERKLDYKKEGREFTCFLEMDILELLSKINCVEVEQVIHTEDVRDGREDEKWVSLFIRRVS